MALLLKRRESTDSSKELTTHRWVIGIPLLQVSSRRSGVRHEGSRDEDSSRPPVASRCQHDGLCCRPGSSDPVGRCAGLSFQWRPSVTRWLCGIFHAEKLGRHPTTRQPCRHNASRCIRGYSFRGITRRLAVADGSECHGIPLFSGWRVGAVNTRPVLDYPAPWQGGGYRSARLV